MRKLSMMVAALFLLASGPALAQGGTAEPAPSGGATGGAAGGAAPAPSGAATEGAADAGM